MRITLLSSMALLLAVACSGDRKEEERRREMLRAPEPAAAVTPAPRQPPLYDENGLLLASDRVVAGLTLPRGLKLKRAFSHRWVYETEVPLDKLKIYFTPLVYGGALKATGRITTYRSARLRSDRTGLVRVDLQIRPLPADEQINLIDIAEVPPPERSPEPTLEAVRKKAARQRQFAH